jgi:hypothetical protein
VPWETRWQNEADKLTFTDDDLVVAENCTTHIIYDPNIRDGKHVDLISLTGKTILHRVEGAGHKAIEAFSKADLLKPLVLSVLQGDLDVSIIQRLKNTGKETLRGHMMINIEERGATRGTADIGPVLQRCIDEAAEVVAMQQKQGKWMTVKSAVLIPAGRWRLETPIKLRTGVSIYGEDQASTLLECAIPSGQFAFSTADEKEPYSLKIKNLHAFSLQRFTGGFLSTRMANRSCIMEELFVEYFETGFEFEDSFTSVMRDCTIFTCDVGVKGRNLTNTKFYNNKIENCASHGMSLTESEWNTSTGLSLFGNIFQGNGKSGLYIYGLDQAYFAGNFFEGNNRIPLRRDGSADHFAHIEICSTQDNFNMRNGNLRFTSTFFTQGHYSPPDTVCAAIRNAESVRFDSGTARAFTNQGKGFFIGESVANAVIEDFTFEGIQPDRAIFGPGRAAATTPPKHLWAEVGREAFRPLQFASIIAIRLLTGRIESTADLRHDCVGDMFKVDFIHY